MEVAAYLSNKAASVTVVGTSSYPFQKSLGPEIGKMCIKVRTRCGCYGNLLWDEADCKRFCFIIQMYEERNVKFYMKDGVTEIRGENGKVVLFTCVPKKTQTFRIKLYLY